MKTLTGALPLPYRSHPRRPDQSPELETTRRSHWFSVLQVLRVNFPAKFQPTMALPDQAKTATWRPKSHLQAKALTNLCRSPSSLKDCCEVSCRRRRQQGAAGRRRLWSFRPAISGDPWPNHHVQKIPCVATVIRRIRPSYHHGPTTIDKTKHYG